MNGRFISGPFPREIPDTILYGQLQQPRLSVYVDLDNWLAAVAKGAASSIDTAAPRGAVVSC
jgi:hypothetical protein